MISLSPNRPALQTGHCVITDYNQSWIESLLLEAALRAGTGIPLVEEIAQAIILYLDKYCVQQTLPLDYLFDRIRVLLFNIGLNAVAAEIRKETPPVDISLMDIAAESSLPLFFYTKLRKRVSELRHLGLTSYHFSGLEHCSLLLGDRRRDCPTARRIRLELEAFLKEGVYSSPI